MMKVEMHMHTHNSSDGLITLKEAKNAIKSGKVDVIAITDHDTIVGWREFKGKEFIKGIEKTVEEDDGNKFHLLIYFLESAIKHNGFYEVIDDVREQDAFVAIAHPYDSLRKAPHPENLEEYGRYVDGIECINARMCIPRGNKKAVDFAARHKLVKIAGSDAHHWSEIGAAYVEAKADNVEEFRKMLRLGRVEMRGGLSPIYVHTFSTLRKHKLLAPKQ
ncbi:MAG: PHP domain-containing protein [Candidatus Micrarchaeota archaeon]|nr:PHP domain-containing protein [Candidatus Micrarchaeota archaeon]